MARVESDPNYSSPTFSRATAPTDPFKSLDLQGLAAAMSTHVHDGSGKGLLITPAVSSIAGAALVPGSVTTDQIADLTIGSKDLNYHSVTVGHLIAGTTGGQATNSTTPVTIPEMTTSFNVGGGAGNAGQGCDIIAIICGTFYMGAPGTSGFVGLALNGVALGSHVTLQSPSGSAPFAPVTYVQYVSGLAVGNNTVTATWSVSGSAIIYNLNAERTLTVVELYR